MIYHYHEWENEWYQEFSEQLTHLITPHVFLCCEGGGLFENIDDLRYRYKTPNGKIIRRW